MTLNQLINLLRKFGDAHQQINEFGRGDIPEIAASKDVTYPLMWVVISTATYRQSVMEYPVRIIFADLIYQDKRNELEVQSDMLQVAQDTIAYLRDNPDFDFTLGADPSISFFSDRLSDLVAGVDLNILVRDPKPLDRCVIP